jgi:hypothetical protein
MFGQISTKEYFEYFYAAALDLVENYSSDK